MAYGNVFPVGYQQFYPQYAQQQYMQQPAQQQQQQQMMTPPTIHAEILQVDSEQSAENYPVAAGASQMMIRKDDGEIYVKTAYANGQSRLDVYVKRPEKPVKPVFDPDAYITKDELENRLNRLIKEINDEHVRTARSAKTAKSTADDSAGKE
jgi:hypothetical protein